MGSFPEPPPLTEAEKAAMETKRQRLAGVLSVYWAHHGYPATEAEGITQANALYHQLYPHQSSTEA